MTPIARQNRLLRGLAYASDLRRETTEAAPLLCFFKGGHFNLKKRPASSYFRSECRALVELLVSHPCRKRKVAAPAFLARVRLRGPASSILQPSRELAS